MHHTTDERSIFAKSSVPVLVANHSVLSLRLKPCEALHPLLSTCGNSRTQARTYKKGGSNLGLLVDACRPILTRLQDLVSQAFAFTPPYLCVKALCTVQGVTF